MAALIGGSLAFDILLRCEGRFADQWPSTRMDRFDVSLQAHTLRREFGGCAGNIAYALRLLGGDPWPVAVLGTDGEAYRQRLATLGISARFVRCVEEAATAQALIVTDAAGSQITAFHPGAMAVPGPPPQLPAGHGFGVASVSPDERLAMLELAARLFEVRVPFVFDPGQALSLLRREDLDGLVTMASWIAVNAGEAERLMRRLATDAATLSRRVEGLVLTRGALGCEIWIDGVCTPVPALTVAAVVDPTGCGDAFRGGLLYGLERGWPLVRCAVLGNRMGAAKIQGLGAQNYHVDRATVLEGLE